LAKQRNYREDAIKPTLPVVEAPQPPATVVEQKQCCTCKFWHATEKGLGLCKRYPPVIVGGDLCLSGPICKFPVTHNIELCGEYIKQDTKQS